MHVSVLACVRARVFVCIVCACCVKQRKHLYCIAPVYSLFVDSVSPMTKQNNVKVLEAKRAFDSVVCTETRYSTDHWRSVVSAICASALTSVSVCSPNIVLRKEQTCLKSEENNSAELVNAHHLNVAESFANEFFSSCKLVMLCTAYKYEYSIMPVLRSYLGLKHFDRN